MEETIDKAKVFFKSIVVPELLTQKPRNKIDTRSTVCSSEDLLPDVNQQAVPSSSVDYAVPPVPCSSVDYVCRVCRQACVDEPAEQSMIALTLLSFLKQSRSCSGNSSCLAQHKRGLRSAAKGGNQVDNTCEITLYTGPKQIGQNVFIQIQFEFH